MNERGQFPVTKQEMATKLAAREILLLVTEDDSCSWFKSENREGIDEAFCAYLGERRFSEDGFDEFRAVMGEAIPGPGPCIYRRISWISKDELLEEDHLSKQFFVPKAIIHW